MARGGMLSQWLPAYQVDVWANRSLIRAFVEVFPEAVLLVGDRDEGIIAVRVVPASSAVGRSVSRCYATRCRSRGTSTTSRTTHARPMSAIVRTAASAPI